MRVAIESWPLGGASCRPSTPLPTASLEVQVYEQDPLAPLVSPERAEVGCQRRLANAPLVIGHDEDDRLAEVPFVILRRRNRTGQPEAFALTWAILGVFAPDST